MNNNLFKDFDAVSAKQWKQKIQVDLKGADYNDTLVWQSLEGIHVRPTYHADDFQHAPTPIPGHPLQWNCTQAIFIDDETIANKLAIDALQRGAEAIFFTAETSFSLETAFKNIPLETITLYFDLQFLEESFCIQLIEYLKEKAAHVYYNIDILGNVAKTGNWFQNKTKDHQVLNSLLSTYTNQNLIGINTVTYQQAGANMVQQLAYGLAHANEYLNHFCNSEATSAINLTVTMAVGSNYFFEIAKLRAFRLLYATLAETYNVKETCHIVAIPSKRNKTIYDYNVNMLRTTSECMSAILGSSNTISNVSYDTIFHKKNESNSKGSHHSIYINLH